VKLTPVLQRGRDEEGTLKGRRGRKCPFLDFIVSVFPFE